MHAEHPERIATSFLRPYWDKYLYNHYEKGIQAGGRIDYVLLFSLIGLFVLLIACINFMNLSTARASRRVKEIGIKKTIGAGRNTLVLQYLSESVLLTFLALGVSLLIAFLLLPQFNFITGKQLVFTWDWKLIAGALAITLLTGVLSGSYPAFYLSAFKPIEVLKGKLPVSMSEIWVRKGLVIFQFTLSVLFIVAVVVIYQQINFVQTKNLGFSKDNILSFKKEGKLHTNLEPFLAEVKNTPGVAGASIMGYSMGRPNGSTGGLEWKGKTERVEFTNLEVGYDLIELLNIPIQQGRSFSREFSREKSKIILNEMAVERMGLANPVGEVVKLWGEEHEVIGIVENFHMESLYEEVKPCFLHLVPDNGNIVVKIQAGRERETIANLEKLYQGYNPGVAFDFTFLDEQYQALYLAEQKVSNLSAYFASVAIIISCLGLFGLAAFTAQKRRKEIGIRKVLGSSNAGIVSLLSGEFMQMVLIAILIALPVSVLLAKKWLEEFSYGIELEWWFFAGAGLAALLISGITVTTQTLRAAKINPIHTLRNE
jgi:ABC-type antimicrobial peptide transport system permease subunit